jgi:hypothetical protein
MSSKKKAVTESAVVERSMTVPHMANYLENIRNSALNRQGVVSNHARNAAHDVERIIADLETWRNEIDATVAFLRATQRR